MPSCLPSHLEVGLFLFSFVDFLVVLAALSPRPTGMSVLLCRGVGSSRPEPWTRLHCSELHWRDPVALSVGQPGAPVSSKDCAHGSCSSFRIRGYSAGPLVGRVVFFLISWLTQWYCYAAMHCRYFAETKTLWEHLNSSAAIFQLGASVTMHVLMKSLLLRQACH